MPEDRIGELRKGYADEDCLGLEPPDLGPLQAVAEGEELAEAVSRLADAYGRPLPADDPFASLARDIARVGRVARLGTVVLVTNGLAR